MLSSALIVPPQRRTRPCSAAIMSVADWLPAGLRAGVDGLGQRLADVRAFLQQRIRALAVKQDETIAAQQRMKEHLDVVGRDVEHTRDEVSEVRSCLCARGPRRKLLIHRRARHCS